VPAGEALALAPEPLTIFRRIVLPNLRPAVLSGAAVLSVAPQTLTLTFPA
jgi:ABC-type spermidine/putrescine transport system permease subunit II